MAGGQVSYQKSKILIEVGRGGLGWGWGSTGGVGEWWRRISGEKEEGWG